MNQAAILYPMMALAALTFAVLGLIPYQRFKAAYQRRVVPADFKFGESARVPPEVSIPNRNYMNLLELPVLFHAACLALYVTGHVTPLMVWLGWSYVALRTAHSLVHLSYNKVEHRLVFFALSNFVLMAMWIGLGLALSR